MAAEYQVITSPVLNVTVSSNVSSFGSERRFQKDLTICALKGKLEMLTGGMASSMVLEVYDKDNKRVVTLDNDDALLGSFPIDDGMRIHVIDKSGTAGQFEDVSKVEKFELAEDEYAARTDSVRAFKQKMKMGRFDPEVQKKQEEDKLKKEAEEAEALAKMKVGDRCEVRLPQQPARRGEIMYIGTTDFKPGQWIGIKYDEPHGKNDGSVQGRRYFECQPKYGGFTKPIHVEVGDFPEEDLGLDDEM